MKLIKVADLFKDFILLNVKYFVGKAPHWYAVQLSDTTIYHIAPQPGQ